MCPLTFNEVVSMKLLKSIAGVAAILAGVAGLVLPIVPGWALIFAGLYLLNPPRKKQHAL